MKDAYWFPHDANAKDDPKCSMLIEQLGLEGYGIYWILVETLRDQPEYKYPLSMLPVIARKYNTTHEKVRVVVGNYGLFVTADNDFFLSESLCRRMEKWEHKKLQASNAGKISAQKRLMLNAGSTDVQQTFNGCSTNNSTEQKKIEQKKIKNVYGQYNNVKLTEAEYDRLKKEFPNADEAIEFFSAWVKEKGGTKSKEHNLAIRRWVFDALKNKPPTAPKPREGYSSMGLRIV